MAVNPFNTTGTNSNILSYTNLLSNLQSNPLSAKNLSNVLQSNEMSPTQLAQDINSGNVSFLDLSSLFQTEEDTYTATQIEHLSSTQFKTLTQYMSQNGIQTGDYVDGLEAYNAAQLGNNKTFQQLGTLVADKGVTTNELEEAALDPAALADSSSSLYKELQSQGVLSVFQSLLKNNPTAVVQQALNVLASVQNNNYNNWQMLFQDIENPDEDESQLDQEDDQLDSDVQNGDAQLAGGLIMVQDPDNPDPNDDGTGGALFGNVSYYSDSLGSSGDNGGGS